MLRKLFLFVLALTTSISLSAQSCNFYVPLKAGKTYRYNLLRGDKLTAYGHYAYTITSASANAGVVSVQQVKSNGKNFEKPCTYYVRCEAGYTYIQADSTDFPAMSWGTLALPDSLHVGQVLPDQVTRYYYDLRNPEKQNGGVAIFNVRVTGMETVKISAGTFDTYVLEYDRTVKQGSSLSTANLLTGIKIHVKDWYAPGTGLVKSERYMGKKLLLTLEFSGEQP